MISFPSLMDCSSTSECRFHPIFLTLGPDLNPIPGKQSKETTIRRHFTKETKRKAPLRSMYYIMKSRKIKGMDMESGFFYLTRK